MDGFYADDLVKMGRTTTRPKRDPLYIGLQRYVYTASAPGSAKRSWQKSGTATGDVGRIEWMREADDLPTTAQRAIAVVLVSVYSDVPEPTFDCTILVLKVPGVNTDDDPATTVAPRLSSLVAAVEAWVRARYMPIPPIPLADPTHPGDAPGGEA